MIVRNAEHLNFIGFSESGKPKTLVPLKEGCQRPPLLNVSKFNLRNKQTPSHSLLLKERDLSPLFVCFVVLLLFFFVLFCF